MDKDLNKMSGPELVAEYNAKSGKKPIKRFGSAEDGRRRVAALRKVEHAEPGIVGAFGVRTKSNRAKLLRKLEDGAAHKRQDLMRTLYGNSDKKHVGAFSMVMKGLTVTIAKKKLQYALQRVKDKESKEVTYALVAKG